MFTNKKRSSAMVFGLSVILVWLVYNTMEISRASRLPLAFTPTVFVFLPQIFKPEILTPTPSPTPVPWLYDRDSEYPDEYTVGKMIQRSKACRRKVHGQFGTTDAPPWSAMAGYITYTEIHVPQGGSLYLRLRYSKYSASSIPILVFLDNESVPRATYYPLNQGSWNRFAWTDTIALGDVDRGPHSIKFYTDGQQYGVADLDMFCLANYLLEVNKCSCY